MKALSIIIIVICLASITIFVLSAYASIWCEDSHSLYLKIVTTSLMTALLSFAAIRIVDDATTN